VLESGQSLQLIQPDSLLQELLHFSPHLEFALCLCMYLGLLLESDVLFLFDNLICFFPKIEEEFILLLNFFFVVDDLLPQVILESDEVVWIPHKLLVD